jgi:HEPN domain-containing protein
MAYGLLRLDPPALGGAAYHRQQAAEKLLKGLLVWAGVDFRKAHDLETLGESATVAFPALGLGPQLTPLYALTTWNTAYRYPGETASEPEPSEGELRDALAKVTRLAETLRSLGPPPASPDGGDASSDR